MKFIVDAQLPKAVSDFLNAQGHDSIHTLDLPDKNRTTDGQIVEIAAKEKRVVISKDSDFLDSYLINNSPEKLVLIKTGNIKNLVLLNILQKHLEHLLDNMLHHS
jgi:predicted nuclease of predicted toxin-antitoxin system